jgi:hypothetical protein
VWVCEFSLLFSHSCFLRGSIRLPSRCFIFLSLHYYHKMLTGSKPRMTPELQKLICRECLSWCSH